MENNQTKVTISLGYTLNLGNFQSLRIDVGVEDSLRSSENVDDGFNRVYEFVEAKLIEKVKEAQDSVQG